VYGKESGVEGEEEMEDGKRSAADRSRITAIRLVHESR
jgi:hypothetical protein